MWEYALDKAPYDGKIVEADGEFWYAATPFDHSLSVTYNGTAYSNPTEFLELESGVTGNEVNGIPWGKKHWFVWNSVANLGAPATTFDNVFVRVVPYDYPPPAPVPVEDQTLGIEFQRSGFSISSDPNGLYLTSWSPTLHTTGNGTFLYTGVNTDEPIEFTFSQNVALSSLDETSIQIYQSGTGTPIDFYPEVSGSTVKIWPQAQEIPARQDVLFDNKAYDVLLPAFNPANPGSSVVQRDGYTSGLNQLDTNKRYLLNTYARANAFQTGSGAMQEGTAPAFAASPLVSPSPATNVPTSTKSLQVKFSERIDADSVDYDNFLVTINAYGTTHSVVPGTIELENVVDSTGAYAILTYTLPDDGTTFPPGATVDITGLTGLTDLYGNPLGSVGTTSFDMVGSSGWTADSLTESFDDANQRNYDETTCWWGKYDPKDPGDFSGYGTDGALTGLFSLGTATNSLTVSSTYRLDWDNTNKGAFEYKDLTVKSGGTLYFRPKNDDPSTNGNYPITLRVSGTLTVENGGYIDVSGSDGEDSHLHHVLRHAAERRGRGAAGGAGGGRGNLEAPRATRSPLPRPARAWWRGAGTSYLYTSSSGYLTTAPGAGAAATRRTASLPRSATRATGVNGRRGRGSLRKRQVRQSGGRGRLRRRRVQHDRHLLQQLHLLLPRRDRRRRRRSPQDRHLRAGSWPARSSPSAGTAGTGNTRTTPATRPSTATRRARAGAPAARCRSWRRQDGPPVHGPHQRQRRQGWSARLHLQQLAPLQPGGDGAGGFVLLRRCGAGPAGQRRPVRRDLQPGLHRQADERDLSGPHDLERHLPRRQHRQVRDDADEPERRHPGLAVGHEADPRG